MKADKFFKLSFFLFSEGFSLLFLIVLSAALHLTARKGPEAEEDNDSVTVHSERDIFKQCINFGKKAH